MEFIPLNLEEKDFSSLMGLNPELLWNKEKQNKWNYESKYSRIYCYCTVHSSSTVFLLITYVKTVSQNDYIYIYIYIYCKKGR
jgi:hypothetical protein